MSAKSRLKYQSQKHNFKPQIPDISESEENSFAESLDSFIDSAESESETAEFSPPVYERKPTLPFSEPEPESEPVIETEPEVTELENSTPKASFLGKFLSLSVLAAFGRKIGSFTAMALCAPFRLARRVSSAVFMKIQSFQKSYVESITAEGPKESREKHAETSETMNEEQADSFSAEQIEATTRQLTELHKKPSVSSEEKREKSPQVQTVTHSEEETYEETEADDPENMVDAFDEDDFDEAVRRARMKLITSAALVFLCVGGFFGYQFFSTRWSEQDTVASEEQIADDKQEKQDDSKVVDTPPPTPIAKTAAEQLADVESARPQPVSVNPPVTSPAAAPTEFAYDPTSQDLSEMDTQYDSFAETASEPIVEPDSSVPDLDSVPMNDMDDFGAVASATQMEASLEVEPNNTDSLDVVANETVGTETPTFDSITELAKSDNDIPDFEPSLDLLEEEPANTGLAKTTLSLSPAQPAATTEQKLQGEMQGTQISLAPSAVGNLPLPQSRSLAQGTRAVPAAPIADQFQAEEPVMAPFSTGPTLASPNIRYETNVQAEIQSETNPNLPRVAGNSRRQAALPFDATRSVTQNPVQASVPVQMQLPASTAIEQSDSTEQNEWTQRKIEYRQYTVQDGDNLFNIAKRELGNVTRWREVYQLNKDTLGENAAYLTPGAEILLPE